MSWPVIEQSLPTVPTIAAFMNTARLRRISVAISRSVLDRVSIKTGVHELMIWISILQNPPEEQERR
jgi:hypothetical protein